MRKKMGARGELIRREGEMKTEVAIVGGGPAGATSAIFLLRQGIRPVIIEKETFPRYHIGESMTGECGAIVRELGLETEMLRRRYPLKHGVKVFGRSAWFVPVMARSADGSLQGQVTWQVRRSDFDQMLLETALAQGAILVPGQAMTPLVEDDGAVRGVRVRAADGGILDIESTMLLDCSGQATFLANAGIAGPKYLGAYDRQMAVFSQISGGLCDDGSTRDQQPGNTLIFYRQKYHWAWWIPLDDETVSVGVVAPAAYFQDKRESKADYLSRELHELHPELKWRLPEIKFTEKVRAIANYSFQVKRFAGKGYLCIGDAHRFVDPIFSFGLFVTMKEAQLAASAVKAYLAGQDRDAADPFADYRRYCERAIDILEDTIDTFWEHPLTFARLVHMDHTAEMIDIFANRVHENQPSPVVLRMRRLLKRERTYDQEDIHSVPIGSRYHPERAPLWEEHALAWAG
jgi:flavin-dependent dehydrogenase